MDSSWETSAFLSTVTSLPQELISVLINGTNPEYLTALSSAALSTHLTEHIFTYFEPLALELCARWTAEQQDVAIAAYGRILPIMPHLSDLAQRLFMSQGQEVDLLHGLQPGDGASRELLLGVFRLLMFDNACFAKFVRPAKLQLLLQHQDRSVRYLAIRVICLYIHASDAVLQDLILKHLGSEPILGAWEGETIDYGFLSLWEEKRLKDFKAHLVSTRDKPHNAHDEYNLVRKLHQENFSNTVAVIQGVLLLRSDSEPVPTKTLEPLVLTPSAVLNLKNFANALLTPAPLLLIGLAGSGKTLMVKQLAANLNKSTTMVTLHLNEQSDAKLLIGVYTTGSQPGSFKWQPGVLTTAVKEGRWVFIEDLDRAPNEVISTMLPLIERRELFIPNRGERIVAASGFRIIATMRSSLSIQGVETVPHAKMLGNRFWQRVTVHPPSGDELEHIIIVRYPLLSKYIPRIMAVYRRLRLETTGKLGISRNAVSITRPISARELLKWCWRMSELLTAGGSRTGTEPVSDDVLDGMFLDAGDCFVGSLEEDVPLNSLMSCIAEELHIDSQRKHHLLHDRRIQHKLSRRNTGDVLIIGRVVLPKSMLGRIPKVDARTKSTSIFALSRYSLRLMEQIAAAVQRKEPLLLVGETGIGKTAAIQHLSTMLGHRLLAINLSQQSEGGDLLGGYKPVNIRSLVIPMKDEFDALFEEAFSFKKNQHFMEILGKSVAKGQWNHVLKLWKEALKMVDKKFQPPKDPGSEQSSFVAEQRVKRRKVAAMSLSYDRSKWDAFAAKVHSLQSRLSTTSGAVAFSFVEGKLVKAIRDGGWVLLDEINLATPDTLEFLSDLLDVGPDSHPSILLTETGDIERIQAHPNFRMFAAMNPATDVGKKDLPPGIRSRFTEIYVNSPDRDVPSLQSIVSTYLDHAARGVSDRKLVSSVTELYMDIQRLVKETGIVDGTGQRPLYSLRTLTRALSHATTIIHQCTLRRALYEGFSMCFFTCLDMVSETRLRQVVVTKLFNDAVTAKAELRKPLRQPDNRTIYVSIMLEIEAREKGQHVTGEQHWLPKGNFDVEDPKQYIITPFVGRNLQNLIRATSARKYPVLIQGPTSAGKTSMIEYLAKRSGNKFVRINNHEHTDLQEYLGTYVSTTEGQLTFQEGVLVQALRRGHWVVLDELNLAPTDVLESLNRLLDDNRELLIAETQEIVRPHPNFMLFATQNPVGPYGGRKTLSRAFRNRFLELHFDDIPVEELNIILARRSNLPESWCGMIVEIYKRLSKLRQEQRLFERNSFATLRDLFRWAFRGAETVEQLACSGYMLLAEKVRNSNERQNVKEIIEQVMSRKGVKVEINESSLYTREACPEMGLYEGTGGPAVVWTKAMRRLFVLVAHAIRSNEPVLLVGETGCGKTTVCQMIAHAVGRNLHIVNAHQNTETGDLIGAQRPTRNRAAIDEQLLRDLKLVIYNLTSTEDGPTHDLDILLTEYDSLCKNQQKGLPTEVRDRIRANRGKRKSLFEWHDGSVVQAMRLGEHYLLDEISLADDSVLERMNSVLDPQRSLLLAENSTEDSLVFAQSGFQFLATMNPGGDFGKKELSPALRNRFTEIWVPPLSDTEDVLQIATVKIKTAAAPYAAAIVAFAKWFSAQYRSFKDSSLSIRDILAWVDFINAQTMDPLSCIFHGAAMVYIDTLGANPSTLLAITGNAIEQERARCFEKLSTLIGCDFTVANSQPIEVTIDNSRLHIGPFSVPLASALISENNFNFQAPTTKLNAMKVVRAMQLSKPILLEGNPGVGKTSIIIALARATGSTLTRINLSEQTDLMDLFGSDIPVENAEAGHFAWRDAPFLTAMKRGSWVLLDEMNLASQSVLEGLNACLDHRGEVYISELDQKFSRHPGFRLFAAQNPHGSSGRKGLPASFVNRFTVVYADVLRQEDLMRISSGMFPTLCHGLIEKVVSFVTELDAQVVHRRQFGARGSPWEFNLRDTIRWLQLLTSPHGLLPAGNAEDFLTTLFKQRFRSVEDVQKVHKIFYEIFQGLSRPRNYFTNLSSRTIQIGLGLLPRSDLTQSAEAAHQINIRSRLPLLESLMICMQQNWPVLLVGSSGVGKTYMLEYLASITGSQLYVLSLSADIDATDLIGGYEQVSPLTQAQAFLRRLEKFLRRSAASSFVNNLRTDAAAIMNTLFDMIHHVLNFVIGKVDFSLIYDALQDLSRIAPAADLEVLLSECDEINSKPLVIETARFEWNDGIIVKALEEGRWLVLDNANLCSSSVLDRLNSLLEPNGSLIINEYCDKSGNAKVVKPHPNFRVFMTMDPQYGEVSRAMRNRAVELFIPPFEVNNTDRREGVVWDNSFLESSMFRFRKIVDLDAHLVRDALYERTLEYSMDSLSFEDLKMLSRFTHQAYAGLLLMPNKSLPMLICERLRAVHRLNKSWQVAPVAYYKCAGDYLDAESDFCNAQVSL